VIFNSMIDETIKTIALTYLSDVSVDLLDSIKKEFSGNHFEISSNLTWIDGNFSYGRQLTKFPSLKSLLTTKIPLITSEQEILKTLLEKYGIPTSNVEFSESVNNEVMALFLELILEGLCHTNPKILVKKEANYVSA